MLQHFETGYDVEPGRVGFSKSFCGALLIVDRGARFCLMQASHRKRSFGHVYPGNPGPRSGHRFRENAAAATDVQHPLTF